MTRIGLLLALAPLSLASCGLMNSTKETARVRVVHASPDAPAVDVVVENGPTLFDAVQFRGVGDYQSVSSDSYTLDVLLDSNGVLALKVPNVTLEPNTNYTIFAIGLAGDASLAALPVVD